MQRIVGHIREHWKSTRIVLRADSGFARDALMGWYEANAVHYVFGLARNARLTRAIGASQQQAQRQCEASGKAARVFQELRYKTRRSWSWSAERRVAAKAEQLPGKANPRFVVTTLDTKGWPARALYEQMYCARGEMENRIKECQLDLFADRTSTAHLRSNQLRLWLSSCAYVLMESLRRLALGASDLARASAGTIGLQLLKIGALVSVSVRRVKVAISAAHPRQHTFIQAWQALGSA